MEKYFKIFNIENKKTKKGPFINNESEYKSLYKYKYTIHEIESILRRLEIPRCKKKKKQDISIYAINMLLIKHSAKKIQQTWRKYFINLFNKTLGPSFFNRQISNNMDDFLTAEHISEIDYYNFFSFKDEDDFTYTFNIISISTLIEKNCLENPYNRKKLNENIIQLVRTRIRYNTILNETQIFEEYKPKEKTINDRINDVFRKIDDLGNYSNSSWLTNMNKQQIKHFLYELFEIWNFRAQLTQLRKNEISPPNGNPFYNIPRAAFLPQNNVDYSIEILHKICVDVMERLVFRASSDSDKNLGALYILSGLTLISIEAREALPWLYASVNYIN
tara:strand:- start:323 stop:1321 length:999 start_codon:yes stop_codon:yes gene_type:complete